MPPQARASQDVILRTTLQLVAERGVDGVTVDTVAATTGVSKATIYRAWPSRAKLIHAALAQLQRPAVEPDTGTVRGDLVALVRQLTSYLKPRDRTRIFASLIDAAARDPELAALHKQNEREGRGLFERAVRRGVERGELPADVDVRLFVDLVMAPFIYRRVVVQSPIRTADIEPIVDHVLAAFTRVTA